MRRGIEIAYEKVCWEFTKEVPMKELPTTVSKNGYTLSVLLEGKKTQKNVQKQRQKDTNFEQLCIPDVQFQSIKDIPYTVKIYIQTDSTTK